MNTWEIGASTLALDMSNFGEEYTEFLALVGNAVCQWGHVEEPLLKIFVSAIGSPRKYSDRARAAYHATVNVRVKRDMTGAALRTYLDDDLFSDWRRLSDRLKKHASMRAQISHRFVSTVVDKKDGRALGEATPKLLPSYSNPSKRGAILTGKDVIDKKRLIEITKNFENAGGILHRLNGRIIWLCAGSSSRYC